MRVAIEGVRLPPPGNWIIQEYIPDLLQTDYLTLAEGIINGVIFGVIVWVIFSIIKMVYDGMKRSRETVVKIERKPAIEEYVTSSARVIEIEGIGKTYARTLNNAGIKTTDELLDAGSTKQGRKELAEKTGINENIILEWVNMADLFRIKGIGEEYSDLLEESGVDTVKELAQRNAENLHAKMEEVNNEKKLVRRTPTLEAVKNWIEQAKSLPRVVEY